MFIHGLEHAFNVCVLVFVEFADLATVAALAEGAEFGGGDEAGLQGVGVLEWGRGEARGEFEVGVVGAGVDGGDGGGGHGRHPGECVAALARGLGGREKRKRGEIILLRCCC